MTKYEEANHLQKKMAWVSEKVERARTKLARSKGVPAQMAELADAERALYRGQCNCPYWHGVFGGLYLNHLRFGVYRELLAAERAADHLLHPDGELRVHRADFNKDGREEVVVETDRYHVVVEPGFGGSITEIDWLKGPINLCDVLTRRPEAYHQKLLALREGEEQGAPASIHDRVRTKEPGLQHKLFYDAIRRASLVDRFLDTEAGPEDLQANRVADRGGFAGRPFDVKVPAHRKGKPAVVEMAREGWVEEGGQRVPVTLTKKLTFSPKDLDLTLECEIRNHGDRALRTKYLSEWNLTLLAGDSPERAYFIEGKTPGDPRMVSLGSDKGITRAGMTDQWLGLRIVLEAEPAATFLRYPVETVSQSEGGFEKVYQGSCLNWLWDLDLAPGQSAHLKLRLQLEEMRP